MQHEVFGLECTTSVRCLASLVSLRKFTRHITL